MSDDWKKNLEFWEKPYYSPNVESQVFRFFGRILKGDLGLPNKNPKSTLIDFGCGEGSAVNFFNQNGFDAYGLDISSSNIDQAKKSFPEISSNFFRVPLDSFDINDLCEIIKLENKVDVITSIQALYYLPKQQFNHLLNLAHNSLKTGGVFYATMMSEQEELFYDNSKIVKNGDGWMREVKFSTKRYSVDNYFMHFIKDKDDLINKFSVFEPLHIGEYTNRFHSDDGSGHHFTFCGIKK